MRINIPHITTKRALIATPIVVLGIAGGVVFAKPDATVYQTADATNPTLTGAEYLNEQKDNLPDTNVADTSEPAAPDTPTPDYSGGDDNPTQPPQSGGSSTGGEQNDQPEQEPEPAPAPTPPPVKLVSATARFEEVGPYAHKLRDPAPKGQKWMEQYCDYSYSNGSQESKFVGFVSRSIHSGANGVAVGTHGC